MPYPDSLKAIHQHYDPTWGVMPKAGDEGKMCFQIDVEWHEISVEGDVFTVWAEDEDAALEEAREKVYEENSGQIEIQHCRTIKPRKSS